MSEPAAFEVDELPNQYEIFIDALCSRCVPSKRESCPPVWAPFARSVPFSVVLGGTSPFLETMGAFFRKQSINRERAPERSRQKHG